MQRRIFATTNAGAKAHWQILLLIGCVLAAAETLGQPGSAEAGKAKSAVCAACHGAEGNSVSPTWPSLAGQHESYIVRQLQAFKDGRRSEVTMVPFALTLSDADMRDLGAFFAAQQSAPKSADPAQVDLGQRIYRGGVPERGVPACIACHGPTGLGNPLAAYPRIGGQHEAYVTKALTAYASGERRTDADLNGMMRDSAESLLEDEIRALANYVQGLH